MNDGISYAKRELCLKAGHAAAGKVICRAGRKKKLDIFRSPSLFQDMCSFPATVTF